MESQRPPYRSPQREAQADATRKQIAAAARRLFVERGWSGTRLRDVAELAGVAEPTVFAVFGSKARLVLGLVDVVDEAADAEQASVHLAAVQDDPQQSLAVLVAFDRRLFERAGDVVGLLRDAGAHTPELAAAYAEGVRRGDAVRRAAFERWPAGTLRDGVSVDEAVARYAALCNIDGFRVLSGRGWSGERIEAWWLETVSATLLGLAAAADSAVPAAR